MMGKATAATTLNRSESNSTAAAASGHVPNNSAATAAPDHFPWEQIIPIAPQLVGLGLLILIFFIVGPRRVIGALRRVRKISIAGLELELAEDVEAAAAKKNVSLSGDEAYRIAQTLSDAVSILSCSRILWVDDQPANNTDEMRALRRVCVAIDLASSTDTARTALEKGVYDLVISDMRRGTVEKAGEELLDVIASVPLPPEIVYYVGSPMPVPKGAAGLTVRPDELFKLIVKVVRQKRG